MSKKSNQMPSANLETSLADHHWLVSSTASPSIHWAQQQLQQSTPIHQIIKKLRRDLSVRQANLVFELAQCRLQGKQKFRHADKMFFDRDGLEMATDQWIAKEKAKRFSGFKSVADVCCGIGGDLLSIAANASIERTTGFDNNPIVALYAQHNALANDVIADVVVNGFEQLDFSTLDALHIDPERRCSATSSDGEKFSPPLSSIIAENRRCSLGIKLAPITRLPSDMPEHERQWIGRGRECKQQVVWTGDLAIERGTCVATIVSDSAVHEYRKTNSEIKATQPRIANQIGDYLFEPHRTVLASGLTDCLAAEYQLSRIGHRIGYLLGDSPISHDFLQAFKILSIQPADFKKLSSAVSRYDFGRWEFKKRGVSESLVNRFKKISANRNSSQIGTLIFTEFNNRTVVLVAKRDGGRDLPAESL